MSDEARKIVIVCFTATELSGRPSMRVALEFAHRMGAVFADESGRAWIREHVAQPPLFDGKEAWRDRGISRGETVAQGVAPSYICPWREAGRACGMDRGESVVEGVAHARAVVGLITSSDSKESSEDPAASGAGTTSKRRRSVPHDDSWVVPLEAQLETLAMRELRSLDVDERFTVARYHALRFGNCTRSEARNRAAGSKVASGLGAMAESSEFGRMRVEQYVEYAARLHEIRGGSPWFSPWGIKAVLRRGGRAAGAADPFVDRLRRESEGV